MEDTIHPARTLPYEDAMAGLQRAVSAGLVQPTTDNAQKRHVQHSIVPHSRSQRKCSNVGQFSVAFNTPWMPVHGVLWTR